MGKQAKSDVTPVVLQAMNDGYDVWMTEIRGTPYSIQHDMDFCWDTEGLYDSPTNIDKVLEVSGFEKLVYVGYSGIALNGDLANKLSAFAVLDPCIKLTNTSTMDMNLFSTMID